METIITMYKTKKKPTTEVDFEWPQDAELVRYGYSSSLLQQFLQDLYKRKNGKYNECGRILITKDDLFELENDFLVNLSWFYEGKVNYDEDITKTDVYNEHCACIDRDIEAAESIINNGSYVFYELSEL